MDDQKDILLIENLVKIAALHKLLVKKGVLSEKELVDEMTAISKELMDQLQKITSEITTTDTKVG